MMTIARGCGGVKHLRMSEDKVFCTLHTVGRSGSFRVRVGVKTSLAC